MGWLQEWATAGQEGARLALAKELAARPEITDGESYFFSAFLALSTARQIGMSGAGPIPFTAILEYARHYGIEGDDFEEFADVIRSMDAAWLEDLHAERNGDG